MKGKKRHDFIYRVLWKLLRRYFARKFNFSYELIKPEQTPYIVIGNHITNWDPILIGLSFGRNMYYVATDQILRMGFKSKLLNFAFAPIPRAKTVNETQTVISIFRRLKEKCNICIFAEGQSTFTGETCEVQPSIGKLVKRAGVCLITYRFTGSYFTLPRWARFIRKGKMEGKLVNIYPSEKIASMTEEEIYNAIVSDITVSAYKEQEKNPVAFKGKNRAEYLETVLYCCPKCKKFATLKSNGNTLSCKHEGCGFSVEYNEYGYFEMTNSAAQEEKPPFRTITDWINWEREELSLLVNSLDKFDNNTPVFSDDDQYLYEIERAAKNTFLMKGKLSLYKDRLSIEPEKGKRASSGRVISFPLDSINELSGFAMTRLIFSADSKIYEIHCKKGKMPRSALKYIDIFEAIKKITK